MNKDTENAEINELRNKGKELNNQLINAEKKLKKRNKSDCSIKTLNVLKDELASFTANPTKEFYKNLETRINNYIKIIANDNLKINENNILNLPNQQNSDLIKFLDDKDNKLYNLYNLIFWYCDIEENLNKLFDQKTSQKTYMELTMNLYKESELDPIMTYINEIISP